MWTKRTKFLLLGRHNGWRNTNTCTATTEVYWLDERKIRKRTSECDWFSWLGFDFFFPLCKIVKGFGRRGEPSLNHATEVASLYLYWIGLVELWWRGSQSCHLISLNHARVSCVISREMLLLICLSCFGSWTIGLVVTAWPFCLPSFQRYR